MATKLEKLINRPERVFVCIAAFFGVLSAFLLPILSVPDENQHFQVEYAMFSSNKHVEPDLALSHTLILQEDQVLKAVRNGTYKNYFLEKTSAQNDGFALNTNTYVFDGKTKSSIFDIMRLPQGLGVLLGRLIYPSLGVMNVMGRLVMLFVYITALFFIIKNVRYGKWVFVFIATLPMMMQQAASLSYDPMNLLAIFAWTAYVINLVSQQTKITRKQIVVGILLAIFLFFSKANNLLLTALLLAVPAKHVVNTHLFKKVCASRYWTIIKYTSLVFLGIIVCAGLYIMSKKLLAGQAFHPHRLWDVLVNTFFWGDLTLVDVTTIGMIGEFSNFYYHIPLWLIVITFAMLIVIMLAEKLPAASKKLAIISGLLFFGSVLLISVGMYYGWAIRPERLGPGAAVTDGIQGRYFTPLLILIFPALGYLQKFIKVTPKNKYVIPMFAASMSVLLLTAYILQTWHFFWLPPA